MDKQAFINQIKDGAIQCMKEKKILASLTIAQAIQESGWGDSWLSKNANNLFGIKQWGYPTFVTMPTEEYINGQNVTVNANFRKYNNWAESIMDHANFLLENSRYANLIGLTDANKAAELIREDGYATDPNYTQSLKNIISENNLTQFDVIAPINQVIASFQQAANNEGLRDDSCNALVVDGDRGTHTNQVVAKMSYKYGATGAMVAWIQGRLSDLRFPCGNIDGCFGTKTKTAVQNFQASKGLVPDGCVGPLTTNALLA
jgi:Muramidase (flagellum-specific)